MSALKHANVLPVFWSGLVSFDSGCLNDLNHELRGKSGSSVRVYMFGYVRVLSQDVHQCADYEGGVWFLY